VEDGVAHVVAMPHVTRSMIDGLYWSIRCDATSATGGPGTGGAS
jgi:hypothetical protein